MTYLEFSKTALKVFRANKKRTFLTMLGIIIGVSSVIIIMSVGAGAQSLILDQITSIGADVVGVVPGFTDENGPPASVYGIQVTTLKKSDADALKTINEVRAVSPIVQSIATIKYGNEAIDTSFVGVTSAYQLTQSFEMEMGSFFTDVEEDSLSKDVVLGWQLWQDLFDGRDPIGQKVKIKKETFRVIGVVEKRGSQGFENQDDLVMIPIKTAQKKILGIDYLHMIRIKLWSENDVDYALTQIREILRDRHDISNPTEDDFTVRSITQALDVLTSITDALKRFLSAIAAISLLVGGVGIMNIMLVAVNERTREIGLRKALGATSSSVQTQFVTEAVILTLFAGIIGLIFGLFISGIIAIVAKAMGYNWDFVVTIPSIILGVGVSGFVGILFGWYPASKASKLEPVESLRYE